MEIYLGKNNTLEIERGFNNVSVVLKYSQDDRKEVEDNEILLYTTDRFILDYNFETGLKEAYSKGVMSPGLNLAPQKKKPFVALSQSRKYFLLKKLRFSHGGEKSSSFNCDINDVVEMDTLQVERDLKIKEILK
jgi:hypothetical protein